MPFGQHEQICKNLDVSFEMHAASLIQTHIFKSRLHFLFMVDYSWIFVEQNGSVENFFNMW